MSVIVTDTGFAPEDWTAGFVPLADLAEKLGTPAVAVDLGSDADPEALTAHLEQVDLIRIDFPSFADGRGFTLARRLRLMGFSGRLRARGHVLAEQYAMARRAGFDEVEIDQELAARQPQDQWVYRSDWKAHDYQSRLRA
jgi:uncharacterized protein (DUF934 family)